MGIARKVAGQLGIPFYAINAQDSFRDTVVEYFLEGYKAGETPNPCLACNRHIRWEFLLNRALAIGADYMATGHYARLMRKTEAPIQLHEAKDLQKDQSYVLSVLEQDQLKHALFPLGDYTKSQVRTFAAELKLPAAESKESQDLCFLAGEDYRDFLKRHAPELSVQGDIRNLSGEKLGEHSGLAHFTIGQRKGLGISSPSPLYVLNKEGKSNTLIVGKRDELGDQIINVKNINWIAGSPPDGEFLAQAKIRYKAKKAHALVKVIGQTEANIHFEVPQFGATPGQAAVIYQDTQVVGSGLISATHFRKSSDAISASEAVA